MDQQRGIDHIHLGQMFELLLEWFPDIIQSVDADGRILYANRRATELLGYTRDELAGMTIADVYAPEIMAEVKAGFQQLKQDGSLAVAESMMVDKQGSRIPVEIRSFAVYDQDDRFVRSFSVIRDIRLLKQMQDSLYHRQRLAAIGELASCVAHDISNPLSVIKLYDEWLLAELRDAASPPPAEVVDRVRDGLGNIDRAAQSIEKLVNHLREFSRAREEEPEPVDLCKAIDDAVFLVGSKIVEHNIRVEKDIPSRPCMIEGYANQIEQVFMNVLSNACDAMNGRDPQAPPCAITLRVEAQADASGAGSCVYLCSVTDNGRGMPPEVVQHAFEPFFTTKNNRAGNGLGLSIVRNIVRRHGGSVDLESTPGQGTALRLRLPGQRRHI